MTTLFRSSVYQDMYPDEEMMSAFGKLNPDVQERNAYFFDMWMKRRANRFVISPVKSATVKRLLKSIGLRDLWDFQIRENEVRFEHAEDLAMFKISWRNNT